MNAGQKYIKRTYFKAVSGDPFYYTPTWDESFHIAPHSIFKVIDMIIKILKEERDSEINWVKTT